MTPDQIAARCDDVVRIYWAATGDVHALKGVDAVFPAGAVTAVVGPSGSGKSSLLRILAGLDQPTAGQVHVAGVEVSELSARQLRRLRRTQVGVVFQRPSENLVSYLTAAEHLRHAAAVRGASIDPLRLLERFGIDHRADHRPAELSGGEQQRLAIAQAVVGEPALLIADEPTAELDSDTGKAVLDLLREVAAAGAAVVISTHDAIAVEAADRTLFLRHGAVQAERTRREPALAVIDGAGRVQLPPEALARFPDRRAVVTLADDGSVRLRAPVVDEAREPHGPPSAPTPSPEDDDGR